MTATVHELAPPPDDGLDGWTPCDQDEPHSVQSRAVEQTIRPLIEVLPFDELFTPEPAAHCAIPALGIAAGPVNVIVGPWATGKSHVLLSMGTCVAAGARLWGIFGVTQGPWMHLDLEMGRRRTKDWVSRHIAGVVGTDRERLRGLVEIAVYPKLDLLAAGAAVTLARRISGLGIVTADPYRGLTAGLDENSSDIRRPLDVLGEASDLSRTPIVLIHHAGLPDVTGKRARRDMGRGSSAINDAVQSKFVVTRDEKGGPLMVTHEKTRELPGEIPDFGLRIVDVEVGGNARGGLRVEHLETAQMRERDVAQRMATASAERTARAETLANYLRGLPSQTWKGTRSDLAKQVGARKADSMAIIGDLVSKGRLVEQVAGRKTEALRWVGP